MSLTIKQLVLRIFSVIIQTYLFWVIFWFSVSFVFEESVNAVVMGIFPPAGLYLIIQYIDFLSVPLIITLITISLIAYFIYVKNNRVYLKFFPIIGNTIFLLIFLLTAELYLQYRLKTELGEVWPECFIKQSFHNSFLDQDHSHRHTVYVDYGYVYRWSFSENGFYKSQTALSAIECTPEYRKYWDNIEKKMDKKQ